MDMGVRENDSNLLSQKREEGKKFGAVDLTVEGEMELATEERWRGLKEK